MAKCNIQIAEAEISYKKVNVWQNIIILLLSAAEMSRSTNLSPQMQDRFVWYRPQQMSHHILFSVKIIIVMQKQPFPLIVVIL